MQFDSDDEMAAEEEAEARRLQAAHAATLTRADFGLPDKPAHGGGGADLVTGSGFDSEADGVGGGDAGTLGAAAQVRALCMLAATMRGS